MTSRWSALLLLPFAILSLRGGFGQTGEQAFGKEAALLYPVQHAGKYGYVDRTGQLVTGYIYDLASPFYEGLAFVKVNGKCGFIDVAGSFVFGEERFCGPMHGDFHEGLAMVEYKGKTPYFKDRDYLKNRKRGYLDAEGKVAIEPTFFNAEDFSEGFAAVNLKENSQWGFINKSGKFVISPRYDFANSFSEGLAAVESGGKVGFIDSKGDWVISPRFDPRSCGRFREGRALVEVGDKVGYIDRSGQFVVAPQFAWGQGYSEGLAVVKDGERWKFVDRSGAGVSIGQGYESVNSFSEGMAAVELGGKWGYINAKGELAVAPQFYLAFEFRNGVAIVKAKPEGEFSYIDKAGKVISRNAVAGY